MTWICSNRLLFIRKRGQFWITFTRDKPSLQNYLQNTISRPWNICLRYDPGTLPHFSVKTLLSSEIIWDTFATESLANPVIFFFSMTFPGAVAQFRLLVSGMHTTVDILLSLNGFPCITSIGRRNPGPDPDGSDKSAHHTSPWRISTIRFVQADCETLSVWKSLPYRWLFQVFRSASWWFHRVCVFPDIQPSLQKKADYATCAYVSHAFQRPGIPNPGLKLQFSYRKYTPPQELWCQVKLRLALVLIYQSLRPEKAIYISFKERMSPVTWGFRRCMDLETPNQLSIIVSSFLRP